MYPGRTPALQCVTFQSLQALLARRGSCVQARIGVVRNEKVRGSNPLSSTKNQGLTCGNAVRPSFCLVAGVPHAYLCNACNEQ